MRTVSPLALTPQKACDYSGFGRTKLLALARAGKIKAKALDGRYYFLTSSLDQFLASLNDAFANDNSATNASVPAIRKRRH